MEAIECDDIDFDIDQDITNDPDVLPITSGAKETNLTNSNHVTNETVVLSDSDEECITINDKEETAKNCDVRCVTVNNIVVNCVSINSCIDNVQSNVTEAKEKKKRKELHSLYTQNKRQRRYKQEKCITIDDDENECVILNDSNDPKRKMQEQKNNNVELVSFNSIGKLVTLEDDIDFKCVTPNNDENIAVNIVTLNDPKNLVTLVNNVNSKNDNLDSNDNDQQLVQSNYNGNTTEKFFEVPLIDTYEESVVKVENISITIEKCIDNEVEKCMNEQFNEECIVKTEKDNRDENSLNNGCSVNLYDSEFTVEEGFVKNLYESKDNAKNNESSSQLECELCPHKSPDVDGLLEHLKSHPLSKYLSCSMCKYKCKNKHTLEAHVTEKHTKAKPFNCSLCPYRCLEEYWLKKHMESHKNKEHKKTYQCDRCEKVVYTIYTFHKHLKKCHLYA